MCICECNGYFRASVTPGKVNAMDTLESQQSKLLLITIHEKHLELYQRKWQIKFTQSKFTSNISSGNKKMEQPSFLATEMMYEAFICFSSSIQK
jgi:hypothetical protein